MVIGRNEDAHLERCLRSVLDQDYAGPTEVLYVDSQSTDRSLEIARSFPQVEVHVVDDPTPNAAKGRNLGWNSTQAALVQFVDGDSALTSDWTRHAVAAMQDDSVGAVSGWFAERHPGGSIYNRVLGLDWSREEGEVDTFGGIVMVRRSCLEETGGFPEAAQTGEDPLLALEMRRRGHRLLALPVEMAEHDLDIHDFGTYWSRSVRTGVSYAEQVQPKRALGVAFHTTRTAKNLCASALGVAVLAAGWLVSPWIWVAAAGLGALDLVRLTVGQLRRAGNFGRALGYAAHLRFSIVPQTLGFFRWWARRRRAGL